MPLGAHRRHENNGATLYRVAQRLFSHQFPMRLRRTLAYENGRMAPALAGPKVDVSVVPRVCTSV